MVLMVVKHTAFIRPGKNGSVAAHGVSAVSSLCRLELGTEHRERFLLSNDDDDISNIYQITETASPMLI